MMKTIYGKVLVKVNVLQKEKYAFGNEGAVLEIFRGFNFNLREDRASLGNVIDGEGLPTDAEVLIHHLSTEPTYLINYNLLSPEETKEGYKVFSIPVDNVFMYRVDGGDWIPCENFLITKRIFKPYKGSLVGIDAEVVPNRMYIVKGHDEYDGEKTDLSGKVAVTLVNCDYEIIFVTPDHKEHSIIRTRNRELQGIDEGMTKQVISGELLVGHNYKSAIKLNG